MWKIESYCSMCGSHKTLDKSTREKDLNCECGGRYTPVFFKYDIECAMMGGYSYILDELKFWTNYKPLAGLDQIQIMSASTPAECKCDEVDDVCSYCIDKYAELSGDESLVDT